MDKEKSLGEIIAEVDAQLKAGEDAVAEARLREAIAAYTEAEPGNVVGRSVLLNELGSFYRHRGIFDKGEEAFLKAKELLEELREYAYQVDGSIPGGAQAPQEEGDKDGRGESQSRTQIIYTNRTMTANYATTLNNLAGLYRMSKQLQKAAETFDAAIKAYETCEGDVPPDDFASSYNNKGLLYLDMQDTHQARAMFLKAKALLETGGNYPYALGTTISNVGFAAVIERKFPEAIECFKAAKALFEEAGDRQMVQNCEKIRAQLEAAR